MLKEQYVYELKHDVAAVLENESKDRKEQITLKDKFSKVTDSIAEYIVNLLINKRLISQNDSEMVVKFLKRYAKIREIKVGDVFTLIIHFPKHKVDRKKRIVSATVMLHEKDKFNSEIAFKISINRLIDTTVFPEIVSKAVDEIKLEGLRKLFKELAKDSFTVDYPQPSYPTKIWYDDEYPFIGKRRDVLTINTSSSEYLIYSIPETKGDRCESF